MQTMTRCLNAHHHIRNQIMVIKAMVRLYVDHDEQHFFEKPLVTIEQALEKCECDKKDDIIGETDDKML